MSLNGQMARRRPGRAELLVPVAALVLVLVGPRSAAAQRSGLGFDIKLGYSSLGGEYGQVLEDGIDGEFNIYYGLERLRLGWGINLVSYGMAQPAEDFDSWSQVGLQWSVAYPFRSGAAMQPYVEGRLTWDRLRPEDHEEGFSDPEEEEEEDPHPRVSGWGGTAVAGVFASLTETVLLDLSARYGIFSTAEADLEYLNQPNIASGNRWGVRLGIVWYP